MGQEPYNMQPPSVFSNSIHPSHRLQPAKKQCFAVKAVHSPRNVSGKRLRDPLFSPYKRVSTFVLKKWKEEVFKSMQKSIKIV